MQRGGDAVSRYRLCMTVAVVRGCACGGRYQAAPASPLSMMLRDDDAGRLRFCGLAREPARVFSFSPLAEGRLFEEDISMRRFADA